MAKGDSLYARVDVDFARSFEFLNLTPGARCLWLFLWCHGLERRMPVLPRPANNLLASQAGLPRHPIESYLRLLHDSGILIVTDSTIEIVGLKEKHKQFQWSKSPIVPQSTPKQPPITPLGTEPNGTERNKDSETNVSEQSSQIENLDFENVFEGPPDPAKENTHSVFIGRLKDIFKGDRAVKNSKAAWQWVSKEWLRVLQKYDPDEEWRRKQLSFEHRLYQVLNEFVEDGRPFDFAAASSKLRNPRFEEQQKRSDAMKQRDQRAGSNLFNEFPEGG